MAFIKRDRGCLVSPESNMLRHQNGLNRVQQKRRISCSSDALPKIKCLLPFHFDISFNDV
ncbi:hypothetical protein CHS0354_012793 [Potamilus streckersoni]|uniref:Uncharacterized protein n=1 Tax=Potamilus streckersoni TaxID=2493646 RepID=A0AAE0RVE9_9BIVA|nr:hypothetical protein CHS0354_012793 [Potamilus streckersoni]